MTIKIQACNLIFNIIWIQLKKKFNFKKVLLEEVDSVKTSEGTIVTHRVVEVDTAN